MKMQLENLHRRHKLISFKNNERNPIKVNIGGYYENNDTRNNNILAILDKVNLLIKDNKFNEAKNLFKTLNLINERDRVISKRTIDKLNKQLCNNVDIERLLESIKIGKEFIDCCGSYGVQRNLEDVKCLVNARGLQSLYEDEIRSLEVDVENSIEEIRCLGIEIPNERTYYSAPYYLR